MDRIEDHVLAVVTAPVAVDDLAAATDHDGTDIAPPNMMSAAAMSATAFQKGLGAIHALSHPIGAHHHTHHGTTNAVFMPTVLKFNAGFAIPKTLTDLGVKDPNLDVLVRDALNDPSTGGNPVTMTEANTRALFESVL